VRIDEDALAEDLIHASDGAKAAIEPAIRDLEADGSFETPPPIADEARFPSWPLLIDRMRTGSPQYTITAR
jgi:hypothetical protein